MVIWDYCLQHDDHIQVLLHQQNVTTHRSLTILETDTQYRLQKLMCFLIVPGHAVESTLNVWWWWWWYLMYMTHWLSPDSFQSNSRLLGRSVSNLMKGEQFGAQQKMIEVAVNISEFVMSILPWRSIFSYSFSATFGIAKILFCASCIKMQNALGNWFMTSSTFEKRCLM